MKIKTNTILNYNGLLFYYYIITLYHWYSPTIPGWVIELYTEKFACIMIMLLRKSKSHHNYVSQLHFSLIYFTRMKIKKKKNTVKSKTIGSVIFD